MSAGGGSVLILVLAAALLQGHAVAPVVSIASAMVSPARILVFWRHIEWRLVRWYLPGAGIGVVLGGWMFNRASADLLTVCVACFLISTIWQIQPPSQTPWFTLRCCWFFPIGIITGMVSAVIGASGLIANSFYLGRGLSKERLLATRAVNALATQILKLAAYLGIGALNLDLLGHGLAIGAGGVVAVWWSQRWLRFTDPLRYRRLAVGVMVAVGMLLLYRERFWLSALFR